MLHNNIEFIEQHLVYELGDFHVQLNGILSDVFYELYVIAVLHDINFNFSTVSDPGVASCARPPKGSHRELASLRSGSATAVQH